MLVSCRLGGQSGGTTPPRLHKAEDGCRQLLSGLAHEACSVQVHLDTLQVPRLPAPVSVLRAPHNVASWQPRRHRSEVHQLHGRLRHLERQQQEAQAVLHSLLGDVAQGDVVVKGGRGLFPPVLSPSLDSAYSDSSRPVSSPTVSTASSSSADGSMSASLSPAAAVPTGSWVVQEEAGGRGTELCSCTIAAALVFGAHAESVCRFRAGALSWFTSCWYSCCELCTIASKPPIPSAAQRID